VRLTAASGIAVAQRDGVRVRNAVFCSDVTIGIEFGRTAAAAVTAASAASC